MNEDYGPGLPGTFSAKASLVLEGWDHEMTQAKGEGSWLLGRASYLCRFHTLTLAMAKYGLPSCRPTSPTSWDWTQLVLHWSLCYTVHTFVQWQKPSYGAGCAVNTRDTQEQPLDPGIQTQKASQASQPPLLVAEVM